MFIRFIKNNSYNGVIYITLPAATDFHESWRPAFSKRPASMIPPFMLSA
jgi:hypothetical protein